MICSIHIDESTIHVSMAAQPSRLWVSFSKKLNSLLDRLNKRCMMHGSQNDTLKWTRGNQNDAYYCSRATLYNNNNNQAFYSQASWGRLEMKSHEQKK
jgi:hypothetical protein